MDISFLKDITQPFIPLIGIGRFLRRLDIHIYPVLLVIAIQNIYQNNIMDMQDYYYFDDRNEYFTIIH